MHWSPATDVLWSLQNPSYITKYRRRRERPLIATMHAVDRQWKTLTTACGAAFPSNTDSECVTKKSEASCDGCFCPRCRLCLCKRQSFWRRADSSMILSSLWLSDTTMNCLLIFSFSVWLVLAKQLMSSGARKLSTVYGNRNHGIARLRFAMRVQLYIRIR